MNFSNENHFLNTIDDLRRRHQFSENELQKLEHLKTTPILSLAYTNVGGFDLKNGSFSNEGQTGTYKLKISYLSSKNAQQKVTGFIPNTVEDL